MVKLTQNEIEILTSVANAQIEDVFQNIPQLIAIVKKEYSVHLSKKD
jgi:hypothetical protein